MAVKEVVSGIKSVAQNVAAGILGTKDLKNVLSITSQNGDSDIVYQINPEAKLGVSPASVVIGGIFAITSDNLFSKSGNNPIVTDQTRDFLLEHLDVSLFDKTKLSSFEMHVSSSGSVRINYDGQFISMSQGADGRIYLSHLSSDDLDFENLGQCGITNKNERLIHIKEINPQENGTVNVGESISEAQLIDENTYQFVNYAKGYSLKSVRGKTVVSDTVETSFNPVKIKTSSKKVEVNGPEGPHTEIRIVADKADSKLIKDQINESCLKSSSYATNVQRSLYMQQTPISTVPEEVKGWLSSKHGPYRTIITEKISEEMRKENNHHRTANNRSIIESRVDEEMSMSDVSRSTYLRNVPEDVLSSYSFKSQAIEMLKKGEMTPEITHAIFGKTIIPTSILEQYALPALQKIANSYEDKLSSIEGTFFKDGSFALVFTSEEKDNVSVQLDPTKNGFYLSIQNPTINGLDKGHSIQTNAPSGLITGDISIHYDEENGLYTIGEKYHAFNKTPKSNGSTEEAVSAEEIAVNNSIGITTTIKSTTVTPSGNVLDEKIDSNNQDFSGLVFVMKPGENGGFVISYDSTQSQDAQ